MIFDSGHRVTQLRLIFRPIPSESHPPSPGTDVFLCYVQRFDIIPQPNPILLASTNQKGPYPHPSTGMYLLKHAQRNTGEIMGDVIPLSQLRTLINLVPRFGVEADNQLTKETALEWSSEYWLNKYFDKELFYALK
jgi:hypothetical protein